jgi:hypothetical protein
MNKRIQELAEQAGFGIAGNPEYIHAMDYDGMCTDELEKFAELIIKECHMLAVGNANWLPKDVSPAVGMHDVFEKYFGVKE